MWLVYRAEIVRAHYKSAAFPAVGETIFVRKMELDDEGVWRTKRTKPVPARVTRVSTEFITAATDELRAPRHRPARPHKTALGRTRGPGA